MASLSNLASKAIQKATFGGGCFWGMEKWYRKQFPNLISTTVGYMGGNKQFPTYKDVCTGLTGHAEVIQMEYDPKKIAFEDLVTFFFRIHDPTTLNRQGNDIGTQYRSVIFYHTDEQETIARRLLHESQQSGKIQGEIVTQIIPAGEFWKAEDYHQKYLEKNPDGYCNHRIRW